SGLTLTLALTLALALTPPLPPAHHHATADGPPRCAKPRSFLSSQIATKTMPTSATVTTTSAAIGCVSARKPRATTKPSSDRLRIQFENGSGLVLATARVPALVACVLVASSAPVSAASACIPGDAAPIDATAINAPPAGRINVCTASQMESTHGI